jgi:hypothetical protein
MNSFVSISFIVGVVPDACVNNMADLQKTKFLGYLVWNCALSVFLCPNVADCISV